MAFGSAPGKVILLGEHAVVYGRPAIAVPVSDVRATANVVAQDSSEGILVVAEDLGQSYRLGGDAQPSDTAPAPDLVGGSGGALLTTVQNTLGLLDIPVGAEGLLIRLHSEIPVARGMGSGSAVATAIVRALLAHYGREVTTQAISDLVYRTEIIFHGTPSGIDNTVVAFEQPVYFIKSLRLDILHVHRPFDLVIADTGIPSKTRDTVEEVRLRRQVDPNQCEALFDAMAAAVDRGCRSIAAGDPRSLGEVMTEDHRLLRELGVSCTELDRLVDVALAAGAYGAKLSGGGKGGCMVALVDQSARTTVADALQSAGARRIMATRLQRTAA